MLLTAESSLRECPWQLLEDSKKTLPLLEATKNRHRAPASNWQMALATRISQTSFKTIVKSTCQPSTQPKTCNTKTTTPNKRSREACHLKSRQSGRPTSKPLSTSHRRRPQQPPIKNPKAAQQLAPRQPITPKIFSST